MYQQQITQRHRTAFILLFDCSASMKGPTLLSDMEVSKAEAASLMGNLIIDELIERASRNHTLCNYYDIAIFGYQGDSVFSFLPESLGDGFASVEYLAKVAPKHKTLFLNQKLDNGGVISVPFVYRPWVRIRPQGCTPMHEALATTRDMLRKWCSEQENRMSFPPMVINITDLTCTGTKRDELVSIAQSIKETSTLDGNTLLINVHLETCYDDVERILFPSESSHGVNSRINQTLFEMSSTIPDNIAKILETIGSRSNTPPYRAIAINTSPAEILLTLNIGAESAFKIK